MARQRLVCFPWAGGGPSAFRDWSPALPPEVEVWGVCLPGHEGRIAEPPVTDLAAAADAIAAALATMTVPLSLFGHSLGAWLAFEVVRRLERRGAGVECLVLSGRRSPAVPQVSERIAELADDALLERVRTLYGGIPAELWDQPEILATLLPAIRGDLLMLESYRYDRGEPLRSSLVVMGGESDPHTAPEGWLDAWCAETDGSCRVIRFPGGHFFIQTARVQVLQTLGTILSPSARSA
jgi:medium-chain acyl-[acyl-carrier-protein] hydrolase